jgi:hypothetical protein
MKTLVFFIIVVLFTAMILRSFLRAREVAAKLKAEPDPIRVALMQREALSTALQVVVKHCSKNKGTCLHWRLVNKYNKFIPLRPHAGVFY